MSTSHKADTPTRQKSALRASSVHYSTVLRPHFQTQGSASADSTPATTGSSAHARQTAGTVDMAAERSRIRTFFSTAFPVAVFDMAIIAACQAAAYGLASAVSAVPMQVAFQTISMLAVSTVVISATLRRYRHIGFHPVTEVQRLVQAISAAGAMTLLATALSSHSSIAATFSVLGGTGLALTCGIPLTFAVRNMLARSNWWGHSTQIIGSRASVAELTSLCTEHGVLGLRTAWVSIQDEAGQRFTTRTVDAGQDPTSAPDGLPLRAVSCVILDTTGMSPQLGNALIRRCSARNTNLIVLSGRLDIPALTSTSVDIVGLAGSHCHSQLSNPVFNVVKRVIDVSLALVAGAILMPAIVVFSALIKLSSPGPLFYGQRRVCKDGRHFTAWKFRTMHVNADALLKKYIAEDPVIAAEWNAYQKLKNDPRIAGVAGKLLRAFSMDEIPQLWNVIRGEMSLVGPRPMTPEQVEAYGENFTLYCQVRPGLTGLWQISGRNHTTFRERMLFDTYYITNWCPWLDFYILGRTVKTIVFREGAY